MSDLKQLQGLVLTLQQELTDEKAQSDRFLADLTTVTRQRDEAIRDAQEHYRQLKDLRDLLAKAAGALLKELAK